MGYSLLGISTSIGSGWTVSAAAWATGPMSSPAGAAARGPGLPARLLPTGAAKPPPALVDDSEMPRCTGPGVAAASWSAGGVSGGGVSGGGGAFGGGGGLFIATRRAGRILTGSAGLGGSGGGGLGSTGRGFTVSTISTSTRSLRCACAGSAQAQAKSPRCAAAESA